MTSQRKSFSFLFFFEKKTDPCWVWRAPNGSDDDDDDDDDVLIGGQLLRGGADGDAGGTLGGPRPEPLPERGQGPQTRRRPSGNFTGFTGFSLSHTGLLGVAGF